MFVLFKLLLLVVLLELVLFSEGKTGSRHIYVGDRIFRIVGGALNGVIVIGV